MELIWNRPADVSLVPLGACGRTVYTGDTLCVANCVPAANRVSIIASAEEMLGVNIVAMPRLVDPGAPAGCAINRYAADLADRVSWVGGGGRKEEVPSNQNHVMKITRR